MQRAGRLMLIFLLRWERLNEASSNPARGARPAGAQQASSCDAAVFGACGKQKPGANRPEPDLQLGGLDFGKVPQVQKQLFNNKTS